MTLVFRTVDRKNIYDCKNDTMIIYPEMSSYDIVHYSLGQDLDIYQDKLLELYHDFSIKELKSITHMV